VLNRTIPLFHAKITSVKVEGFLIEKVAFGNFLVFQNLGLE